MEVGTEQSRVINAFLFKCRVSFINIPRFQVNLLLRQYDFFSWTFWVNDNSQKYCLIYLFHYFLSLSIFISASIFYLRNISQISNDLPGNTTEALWTLWETPRVETCVQHKRCLHYGDVIMGATASQITSLTIVYSTVYSADQRKHQSAESLAFVRGIHRGPVNSPHKGPVTRKMSPFDDVIMSHEKLPKPNHDVIHWIVFRC